MTRTNEYDDLLALASAAEGQRLPASAFTFAANASHARRPKVSTEP
jgi:hypothetical protein